MIQTNNQDMKTTVNEEMSDLAKSISLKIDILSALDYDTTMANSYELHDQVSHLRSALNGLHVAIDSSKSVNGDKRTYGTSERGLGE